VVSFFAQCISTIRKVDLCSLVVCRGAVVAVRVRGSRTGWCGVVARVAVGGCVGVAVGAVGVAIGDWDWFSTNGTGLSVLGDRGGLLLTAEQTLAVARGVVVGWAWSQALLLLMVAHEHDLHGGGAEEEEGGDDGDGEDGSVELAGCAQVDCVGVVLALISTKSIAAEAVVGCCWSITERCLDVALARVGSIACQDSDGDHCSGEEDVENDSDDREARDAAQAACQDNGAY
jgi:hypothetical protein